MPPRIQAGPRVMKVQMGHPVDLPCIAQGFPEPTITWTRDSKRYPVSPDGSLSLSLVNLVDEGTYTCTASNSAGTDEARVQLLVQGRSQRPSCDQGVSFLNAVIDLRVYFQCPQWWRCWSPLSTVHCRRELQTSVLPSLVPPKVQLRSFAISNAATFIKCSA